MTLTLLAQISHESLTSTPSVFVFAASPILRGAFGTPCTHMIPFFVLGHAACRRKGHRRKTQGKASYCVLYPDSLEAI